MISAGMLLAAVAAFVASSPASAEMRTPDRETTYRILVTDGRHAPVALHVEEAGQGPPIVLLHGLGASTYLWRFMIPELARTHRVIALDLKGFGRSDKPFDTAYSAIDQARLVGAFLRKRRLAGVTLVGHSFGGLVALMAGLEIEHTEPRLIRHLVLVSAPALPQPPSPAVAFLQQPVLPYLALMLLPPEVPAAFGLFTEAIGMEHITSRDVTFYAEPLREAGGRHALVATARSLTPAGSAAIIQRYRTMRIRTSVVACRGDMTVPIGTAERLVRSLPRARLTVLEGCDHIPPEQAPDRLVDVIRTRF
jgi:pimeloyl-ACP methyl ester carboxylesterase